MRVQLPGVRRDAHPVQLSFEEQSVQAYPGESLAAALLSGGVRHLRTTRDGAARGLFCGMGVCGECLVEIEGSAVRACMEPVREGMQVHRHCGLAVPRRTSNRIESWEERQVGVLVLGAGPAGLSAGLAAARCDADVLIVDERSKAGGQFFKQPGTGFTVEYRQLDGQFAAGRRLWTEAEAAGARFLLGATVWGAFDDRRIGVLTKDGGLILRAEQIVVCPGAYERPILVPGWTLPGVMTTGAAQSLLRAHLTSPGKRVLVAGNGPLNLQVADELVRSGVNVVAVAELARGPGFHTLGPLAAMASSVPGLVARGVRHTLALRRSGVPLLYEHVLTAAHGETAVRRVTLVKIDAVGTPISGTEQHFEVDAVCMGYGFAPQSEIARALGCRYTWDAVRGTLVSDGGADGSTNVPGVYVAGDAGGLAGAHAATAQGTLAGIAAARAMGLRTGAAQSVAETLARRKLRRHGRFQGALWKLYKAPRPGLRYATADTLICRCEQVDLATARQAMQEHSVSMGSVKRATRAGMGACQGRYCSIALADLAESAGLIVESDADFFAPRAPFKPMSLGRIAVRGEAIARRAVGDDETGASS